MGELRTVYMGGIKNRVHGIEARLANHYTAEASIECRTLSGKFMEGEWWCVAANIDGRNLSGRRRRRRSYTYYCNALDHLQSHWH